MKFFACFVFAAVVAVTIAMPQGQQEYVREKKSAYGPAPAPAIPCPKSVVVSCAPLVQKVPCKAGAAGGHAGAYSELAPQYLPYSDDYYNEYYNEY